MIKYMTLLSFLSVHDVAKPLIEDCLKQNWD